MAKIVNIRQVTCEKCWWWTTGFCYNKKNSTAADETCEDGICRESEEKNWMNPFLMS